jgi:NitT/TauT family transport system permease protein
MRRTRTWQLLGPVIATGLLVVFWEAAVRLLDVPSFIVPPPSDVLEALVTEFDRILEHTWVTLVETLAGFALSIAIGIPLAILISYSPVLYSSVYPILVVFQSVPKIAIAPALILIVGTGLVSKTIVAFLVAFFPIVVSTTTGLRGTPPELIELSRVYRAGTLRTFRRVRFPWSLPFVFAGLRIAITLAVIGAVVAEFVGSNEGLGYLIISSSTYFNSPMAYASMVALAVMSVLLYAAVEGVERLVLRHRTP